MIAFVKFVLVAYLFISVPCQLRSQGSDLLSSQIQISAERDTLVFIPIRNIRAALFMFDTKNNLISGLENEVRVQGELLNLRAGIITEQGGAIMQRDSLITTKDKQISHMRETVERMNAKTKVRTRLIYGLGGLLLLGLVVW